MMGRGGSQGSHLCQLFLELSRETSRTLGDAARFGMDIGEESITDQLLLELKRRAAHQVHLRKFNRIQEGRTTGADWEWWFVSGSRGFGMRVQAKKLDSRTSTYPGLDHTVRGSRKRQINLLIDDASNQRPPLYPAYLFYNVIQRHAIPGWICGSYPPEAELLGCAICDAYLVKSALRRGIQTFSHLGAASYPWNCLVCCNGYAAARAPLPDRVFGVARAFARGEVEGGINRRTGLQRVAGPVDELPSYVRDLMERSPEEGADLPDALRDRPVDGAVVVGEEKG